MAKGETRHQAAMAEIHQTADLDQREIVQKADSALMTKKTDASNAETLTQLDAMIPKINSIRQQYMMILMKPVDPVVKSVSLARNSLCYSTRLKNDEEIEQYVDEIRAKLKKALEGQDEVQII